MQPSGNELTVYTDSQTIMGLPERREGLELNDFHTKNKRPLINAQLYREFYRLYDHMKVKLVKVRGHLPTQDKERIDQIFSLVDKASRHSLRKTVQDKKPDEFSKIHGTKISSEARPHNDEK